jgi:hypothetical protein
MAPCAAKFKGQQNGWQHEYLKWGKKIMRSIKFQLMSQIKENSVNDYGVFAVHNFC